MADGGDYNMPRQRSETVSQRSVRIDPTVEQIEQTPSVPSIVPPPSSNGTAVADCQDHAVDMEAKPLEATFSPDPQVKEGMLRFRQKRSKTIDLDDYFVRAAPAPAPIGPY